MTQELRDPLIGRLVDRRYLVTSRVARGGMATVYCADDQRLDRTVALKVMHMHLADDEEFRDRFIQEAKVSARVQHPNVVSVFDQGTDGEVAYLVMEYVPSMTLRDYLLKHQTLTPKQAMQVTEAVLAGLAAAHRADLVHRDIKPENILLANDGRIKVSDFGLARASTKNTATGKALLGTIAYLSPELVTRGQADKRSDIYAVGIMLFEMLTGKQPFTGDQPMQIAYQHANDQVPPPSTIEPGIPRSLDLIVEWATQRDPSLRPSDAGELLTHVQEVRGSTVQEPQKTLLLPTGVDTQAETLPHHAIAVRRTPDAPERVGGQTGRVVRGAPAALASKAGARRRRGFVWLALAVILAVTAGVGGWWMSMGPGARYDVPQVVGSTFDEAREALTAAGFETPPEREDVPDYDVPAGEVMDARPGAGTSLPKDAVVTLVVSSGRQDFAAPSLAGLGGEEAQRVIEEAGFTFDEDLVDRRFNGDVPRGTVVHGLVRPGDDLEPFEPDDEIEERTPMGYLLSLGGIPAQAGQHVDDARAALEGVDLQVEVIEEHSTEVDSGHVMEVIRPDGAIREGATITLKVSLGPPPVTIPEDIMDKTFRVAVQELRDLGFDVVTETDVAIEALWGAFGVESIDPAPGESIPQGSTVTIVGEY